MSKSKKNKKNIKQIMDRYYAVFIIAVVLGLVVVGQISYLSVVEGDYWAKVAKRFVRDNVPIKALRGNILACDGQVLATSLPEYKLYMDFMDWEPDSTERHIRNQAWRDSIICADTLRVIPGKLNRAGREIPEYVQRHAIDSCKRELDRLCQGMHNIFPEIDPVEFRAHLLAGRAKKSHNWPLYRKKVSYIEYRKVKELPVFCFSANRGGFHVQEFRSRQNPYGKLAARTVGDLYGGFDDSARCGLELSMDSLLRGKPGYCHRQKVLNHFVPIYDKMPENGYDVRTTLDINMQDLVEKSLGDQLKAIGADFGVCILMEVATGDIKAISSLDRLSDGSYREVSNRAVSQRLEPGSVFKTVSFMVGLDDGAFKLTDMIDTGNGVYEMYKRSMKDSNWRKGGHHMINASEVLEMSSNIGTSRLIDRYYHDTPEKYVAGVYRTGINEDLQLPLVGYAKPPFVRMPKKDKTGKHWANWSNTALPWMSIGYETQVPPISTLTFYNGIANNGKMLYPRFVKDYEREGEIVKEYPVRVLRENMCKPSTIKDLQSALRNTVLKGTGKPAGSKHFHVSGKTGTAQIWTAEGNTSKYLVSFVGYFPSEAPKYTMIVCIKKSSPAYGGTHCGPVFKRVAEAIMAQKPVKNYNALSDTVNVHYPVVHPGNVSSTVRTMAELGIQHKEPAGNGQWGTAQRTGGTYVMSDEREDGGLMPNVKGYGLRDAIYRLEKMRLNVRVSGRGRVVSQSVKPGDPVRPGNVVKLVLTTDGKPPKQVDEKPKADSLKVDTTKTKVQTTTEQATKA